MQLTGLHSCQHNMYQIILGRFASNLFFVTYQACRHKYVNSLLCKKKETKYD